MDFVIISEKIFSFNGVDQLMFDIFIEQSFTESQEIMETNVQENGAGKGAYEESHSYHESFKGTCFYLCN